MPNLKQKFITVLPRFGKAPDETNSKLFLTWDNWNDYSFYTTFGVFYIDENSQKHELEGVKIGYFGQNENETKLKVGDSYDILPEEYFSLGTVNYYETLNKLGDEIRDKVLNTLHDIAKYPQIFEKAINERVTTFSFLRSMSATEITGQLRRMANGGSWLHKYNFAFKTRIKEKELKELILTFDIAPESNPPTNINILIGRNGSGKTTIINNMIATLLNDNNDNVFGEQVFEEIFDKKNIFPLLINVSFSAFDNINTHVVDSEIKDLIKYFYIGLKKKSSTEPNSILLKSPDELSFEFYQSLNNCRKKLLVNRWQNAISILESDPNFKDEDIRSLIQEDDSIEDENIRHELFKEIALVVFSKLSSGHKIVLLTITRLVELVEEKTLVLIDEPETHLHPPLLSAFTRSLSDLLIHRNGVAIIATHSPVILQEVPRSCVWHLKRNGEIVEADRLRIESFGENVGILTYEVFSLEVTNSGFHKRLKEAVDNADSYEEVIEKFNNNIGLEAKSILRSLFYQKNQENDTYKEA